MSDQIFSIDFSPYHVAGRLLAEGRTAELIPLPAEGLMTSTSPPFLENFRRYFFPDSPFATGWIYMPAYAWLFRPLARFEFPLASRLWLLINALLGIGSVALIALSRPWSGKECYRRWRLSWILFIGLTFQPVLDNMWHGNTSALILFAFCLSYFLLGRRHDMLAGLVLGLIVPLKYYPALLVLYFLWRRNWAFVAGAICGATLIVLTSWLTVGTDNLMLYFRLLAGELGSVGVAAFNNQSLTGFLLHVMTAGNVNGWETTAVPFIVTATRYILILILLGLTARVMSRKPEHVGTRAAALDLDLGLVIGMMLLVAPVTWYHYYVWLLLPLIIVFDHLWLHPEGRWFVTACAIAYGLIAMQGISGLRLSAPGAVQEIWLLRLLMSSSFVGQLLLFGLTLRLRAKLR